MAMPSKRWPVQNFNALIKKLENAGRAVYVFGAPFDRAVMEEAAKGTGAVLIERSLRDFAFYAGGMDVFISCDTGPLHIAAALGVKTIGLFGPTSPDVFGARGKNSINLWRRQDCAPCLEPGTVHKKEFLKCADNACMKNISVEIVLEAVEKLLKSN